MYISCPGTLLAVLITQHVHLTGLQIQGGSNTICWYHLNTDMVKLMLQAPQTVMFGQSSKLVSTRPHPVCILPCELVSTRLLVLISILLAVAVRTRLCVYKQKRKRYVFVSSCCTVYDYKLKHRKNLSDKCKCR